MDTLIMNGSQQPCCPGMRPAGDLLPTVTPAAFARQLPAAAFVDVSTPSVLGAPVSIDHSVEGFGFVVGTDAIASYGVGRGDKTDATPVGSATWSPPI